MSTDPWTIINSEYQWPNVQTLGADEHLCVRTFIGKKQYGEIVTLPKDFDHVKRKSVLSEMESNLRELITSKVITA